MNWLILYDIRDARRLRRVEKIVSSYGWRVQKSVFESDAPQKTIEIMKYRLGYAIDESEDFILIFDICEKDWQKKEKYGINCEHEIIKDNQNYLREEYEIQQELNLKKQDRMLDSFLKKQDKQFKVLQNARQKIENGNIEEGISIIEDITYNQGGIIFRGISWPMYLAEVLYKNKMYDRCWKYLNHISLTHLDCLPKIKNLQSKICSKEKKYNDAFFFYVMSVVYTYQGSSFKPTKDIIRIKMDKKMNKVKINISKDILYQKILMYINNQLSEIEIRNDLIKIFV